MDQDNRPIESGEQPWVDPVIEAYKKDIDRTLIRHNLRLTVQQRLENLQAALRDLEEIRLAVAKAESARGQTQSPASRPSPGGGEDLFMTQNVEIPDALRGFAEEQAAKVGSFSEYVAALIRQDQERAAKLALECELLKGVESGRAIDATDEYWNRKEAELVQRHAKRGG